MKEKANTIGNIPQISPIQFLHTGKVYVSLGIVLFEGIVLFILSFSITMIRGKKNDIF